MREIILNSHLFYIKAQIRKIREINKIIDSYKSTRETPLCLLKERNKHLVLLRAFRNEYNYLRFNLN